MVMLLAFPWNPSGDLLMPKYLEKTPPNPQLKSQSPWGIPDGFCCPHPTGDLSEPSQQVCSPDAKSVTVGTSGRKLMADRVSGLPGRLMFVCSSWWLLPRPCTGTASFHYLTAYPKKKERLFYMKTKLNGIQRCTILKWFSFCCSFLTFFWDILNAILV